MIVSRTLLLVILLILFSCDSKEKELSSSDKNTNISSTKFKLIDILINNDFSLDEEHEISFKSSPLFISEQFELLTFSKPTPTYLYEKWSVKDDTVELWKIHFDKESQCKLAIEELNKLCNEQTVRKVIFQKNIRYFEFNSNSLLLFKHEFYSKQKQIEYKSLINYLNENFKCW